MGFNPNTKIETTNVNYGGKNWKVASGGTVDQKKTTDAELQKALSTGVFGTPGTPLSSDEIKYFDGFEKAVKEAKDKDPN